MSEINIAVVEGNLTRDPEVKTLPSGTTICNFSIGHTERRKNNQTGEWSDVPHYFDLTVFNGAATVMAKAKKGDRVVVAGRLQYRSWKAQDGTNRNKIEILANQVSGEYRFRKADGSTGAAPIPPTSNDVPPDFTDDDIPF